MCISDWSSDGCSSDLLVGRWSTHSILSIVRWRRSTSCSPGSFRCRRHRTEVGSQSLSSGPHCGSNPPAEGICVNYCALARSEEHTSELQSLMRISYAVFCLKKKKKKIKTT